MAVGVGVLLAQRCLCHGELECRSGEVAGRYRASFGSIAAFDPGGILENTRWQLQHTVFRSHTADCPGIGDGHKSTRKPRISESDRRSGRYDRWRAE